MRTRWRRLTAALVGLWLSVLLAEPLPLHACSMHDPAAPAHASSAHHMDAHAGQHDPAPPPDAPEHSGCLCLGDCCAASAAALATLPVRIEAPPVVGVAPQRPGASAARTLWSLGDHRQPWPTAPPHTA